MKSCRQIIFVAIFLASVACPFKLPAENAGERDFRLLPQERIFAPRIADPGEVQLSARFLSERREFAGNIGYSVGLLELAANKTAVQLRVEGNTYLVSKLVTPDFPVQSTDYTIAVPLDWRYGAVATRLRWGHRSSHLGDDFNRIEDVWQAIDAFSSRQFFSKPRKFSREFIELFGAFSWSRGRIYAGAHVEYHIAENRSDPVLNKPWFFQLGAERYFAGSRLVRPFTAIDLKVRQQFDWQPDFNLQAGVGIGKGSTRQMRLALEYFRGYSNQGQFYLRKEIDVNLVVAFDF